MLPIQLRAEGRVALVVGAGAVGRRKAAAWRAAGGLVRVVDPDPAVEAGEDDELVSEPFAPSHLEDVAVVFACATEAANAGVVAVARANGVLVCDAARPDRGDFTLPAVVRRGPITMAISTGGAAPALAARLRDRLDEQFDEAYSIWGNLLGAVRPAVLQATADADARRDLLRALTDPAWLERLRQVGPDAAEAEMRQFVAAATGGPV